MKPDERVNKPPELRKIAAGWAAFGRYGAVHGKTQEEALEKHREAEKLWREILLRRVQSE